jgi:hypothetical protein
MKNRVIIYCLAIFTAIGLISCNTNDPDYYDNTPPAAPSGVTVYNGDNTVLITWDYNRENDVDGYNVYYATSYNGKYTRIGYTKNNYFNDDGAQNGEKYYYAVEAYDFNGNISDLSYEEAYATPRPQGSGSISDYIDSPSSGAFSFTTYTAVPVEDNNADVLFDRDNNGNPYLFVYTDSDIQDMGRTNDIYDIPYAPGSGWSSTKDAVAIVGHTYVIWTWDNHYAKVRIKEMTTGQGGRIVFDWAFQLVEGEKQLKPVPVPAERSPRKFDRQNSRKAAK